MTTGADIYNFLKNGIDQNYTDFLNIPRANRLIKEAAIRVAELTYSANKSQKQSDELSPLTVIDASIPVRGTSFRVKPLQIAFLTVAGTVGSVTVRGSIQIVAGESFTIKNSQGLTPGLNGTFVALAVTASNIATFNTVAQTGAYVLDSGQLTHGLMLADMIHPLAIRATFLGGDEMPIESVVTATPYIKFATPNHIREGSSVRISGALGVVGLNGTFYVKQRNRSSFRLFTDEALTIAPTLSGTYQGGGVVKLLVTEQCTKMRPDRRIAASTQDVTEWTPQFTTAENTINLFPKNRVCESVEVDYMREPPVEIIMTDTVLDLELTYNYKFLMKIKGDAVNMFMLQVRELQSAQAEMIDDQVNP